MARNGVMFVHEARAMGSGGVNGRKDVLVGLLILKPRDKWQFAGLLVSSMREHNSEQFM